MLSCGVRVTQDRFKTETVAVEGSREHVAVREKHLAGLFTPTSGSVNSPLPGLERQKVKATRQQRQLVGIQHGGKGLSPLQGTAEGRFNPSLTQLTQAQPELEDLRGQLTRPLGV